MAFSPILARSAYPGYAVIQNSNSVRVEPKIIHILSRCRLNSVAAPRLIDGRLTPLNDYKNYLLTDHNGSGIFML